MLVYAMVESMVLVNAMLVNGLVDNCGTDGTDKFDEGINCAG